MWVQLVHFGDVPEDHPRALAALIASPGYAHDFASPFSEDPQRLDPPVHGRWRLDAISVDSFKATSYEIAEAGIREWANEQDWMDPSFRQPPEVDRRLAAVYDLLRKGSVYQLINPDPRDMHEYGEVTGTLGFHEFVVVDHANRELHLIVASDD